MVYYIGIVNSWIEGEISEIKIKINKKVSVRSCIGDWYEYF